MSEENEVEDTDTTETEVEATETQDTLFDVSDETDTDSPEDKTDETKDDDEKLEGFLDGKFKTQEDFEKSYKELTAKLREKHEVPDAYEVNFEETGLQVSNEEEWNVVLENLKENNFSQTQVNLMMGLAKQLNDQFAEGFQQAVGPISDPESEKAALLKEWGDQTTETGQKVTRWAQSNLDQGVWGPLAKTAAGMKYLHDQMNATFSNPLNNTTAPDNTASEAKIDKIMSDPNYEKSEAMQKQVYDMLKAMRQ